MYVYIYIYIRTLRYITDAFLLSGALLYGGQLNQATRYPKPKDLTSQLQLAMYRKKIVHG